MFAQALLELDLSQVPLEGVCIRMPEGERFQKFIMENPPSWCAGCRRILIQQNCFFCPTQPRDKGKAPLEDSGHPTTLDRGGGCRKVASFGGQ